ncbi:GAF domain-containing protein [Myxococcota bacterium]|nr:GAF domain-containing protein [Myxococcota bacterium]
MSDKENPASYQNSTDQLDIVKQIVNHRLQQSDLRRILDALNEQDREDFTFKMADILRKTSALLEVSKQVNDTLSLDTLLNRMVNIISNFLDADRCTLFLYDEQEKELFSRVAGGGITQEIRFPSHMGIAGASFTNKEVIIIDDAYSDERFNREIDIRTGYTTKNILCCPIKSTDQRIIGVAQVLNKFKGPFDAEDLNLLEALTAQAASAFINTQLHERIERAKKEESQMLEITTAISRELQLEPLLQKIMGVVTEILDADRSTLFMYDKETDELWSHVAQGMSVSEIRFPAHLGIAGSVFMMGETINIPDAYKDSRFNPAVDKKTGYKTDTILCMPIQNKQNEIIGVVQVLNKRGGPFRKVDERRLAAFSSQAAIAIENARLFEDVLQIKNYNESILQSMSNGVITLNANNEIVTANHAALHLFHKENKRDEIIGIAARRFFSGQNTWIAESIENVRSTGETDNSLDVDLWLNQQASEGRGHQRREKASVNLSIQALKDSKHQHLGCLLILEDITQEKRLRGTMARYLTKELADQLLDEDSEAMLGGKIQRATVLFTDIRSFTTISEQMGAQKTVTMLNEYFSIMVDSVLENGGILDKYIGDAIMAVFGAPIVGEQDADNALITAISMLRSLEVFNRERQEKGEQPVFMGVGINTDEILSGNIGSLKRMDYTVIGDGVNLASRLEGANKLYGSQILLSELTRRALKHSYLLRKVDLTRVKGKKEPVAIFEALDHLKDELGARTMDIIDLTNRGFIAYQSRDFLQATRFFREIIELRPNDGVARLYLERCAHFMESAPPRDWDGVWVMTSK